ncbi:MAG TPA: hypothetical protein VGE52_08580, partial [Pirellulales bacterium]
RAIVPNRVGEAAFFLLSTLPLTRLPDVVRGRHGCLERKFFGCRDRVFGARERGRGGTIVSPVERRRDRLSDRAWAALIEDDTIPEHSGAWRDDGVEESADAFASSLYSAALRDPGRFARLGATVRRVAHGVYLDRLWLTVSGARPGSEVPEAQRPAWRPADACDLERLYWRHDHLRRDGCDRGLCSAVAERPAAGWSDAVIEKLIELCTASLCPRPDDWSLVARVGEVTVQNVETTAINRVRSLAVFALTAVLDEFPDRLDAMESALTSAARDPHPSVRAAMLSALAVVWPLRESLAIELFATLAADPEDQIWATSYGRRLLPFVHSRYVARVHPLLDRMVASPIAEARRFGAERVAAEWVWHGGREESYRLVANSEDPQHRTGVVRVLESDAAAARPSASVGDLIDYFDDQDAEVRRRAGGVFRRWNRENHATMSRLAEPFLRSQAFREDPSRLLFCLGHAPVDLTDIAPTAFAVVRAAHDLMASGVAVPTSQLHVNDDLSRLLLRIYEAVVETRDQALETACLDAWDQYVQTGLPCAQHDLELLSRG